MNGPSFTLEDTSLKSKVHMRRSKTDQKDRDFTCGCGKKYLSYPALYTHIKTKHHGSNPSGTLTSNGKNKRGRGRPKAKINQDAEAYEGKPTLQTAINKEPEIGLFSQENYFQCINIKSGPSNIYNALQSLMQENTQCPEKYEQILNSVKEMEKCKNVDEEKVSIGTMTCDRIFAHFLIYMQNTVCQEFLKSLAILIRYLRDCLNSNGWSMPSRGVGDDTYCARINGEYIPDICNEFITEYLPSKCPSFNIKLSIKIILYLCNWLSMNKYTTSRLTIL